METGLNMFEKQDIHTLETLVKKKKQVVKI